VVGLGRVGPGRKRSVLGAAGRPGLGVFSLCKIVQNRAFLCTWSRPCGICHPKPMVRIGGINYLVVLWLPELAEVLPDIHGWENLGSLRNVRWIGPRRLGAATAWPLLRFVLRFVALLRCGSSLVGLADLALAEVVTRRGFFDFMLHPVAFVALGGLACDNRRRAAVEVVKERGGFLQNTLRRVRRAFSEVDIPCPTAG
jgi:hypothetical protein